MRLQRIDLNKILLEKPFCAFGSCTDLPGGEDKERCSPTLEFRSIVIVRLAGHVGHGEVYCCAVGDGHCRGHRR